MRFVPLLLLVACNGGSVEPVCESPSEVPCIDDLILDLGLQGDATSDGEVTTSTEGDDFVTAVDARAGGTQQASNNPWVYVKFDEDGAHRVDIDDETALTSMDWDLAARRFILRLNSGTSGPSCVGAAALYDSDYADVTEVPEGVTYGFDDFYTEDCTMVNDSSGLPGSPQVVLGPWWEYPGCVATSGIPFLVQVADGRVLKLRVEQYYGEGQDVCNESGTMGGESGRISMRWQWLP